MPTYYDMNKMEREDKEREAALKAQEEAMLAPEQNSPEIQGQLYEPQQNEQMLTQARPFVEEDFAQLLDAYNISKNPLRSPADGYVSPNTENTVRGMLEQNPARDLAQVEEMPEQEPQDLGELYNQNVNLGVPAPGFDLPQAETKEVSRIKGNASPRQNLDQIKQLEDLLNRYREFSASAQDRLMSAQQADQQTGLINAVNQIGGQLNQAFANRAGNTDIKVSPMKFNSQYAKDLAARLGIEESQLEKDAAISQLINKAKSPVGEIKQLGNELYEVQPDGTIKALVAGGSSADGLSAKDRAFLALQDKKLKQSLDIFNLSEKRRVEAVERAKLTKPLETFNRDKVVTKAEGRLADADAAEFILKSKNPVGDEAVKTFLARASGEVGTLTDQDAARFGGSKALTSRLAAIAKQYSDGTLTDENRNYLLQLTNSFKQSAQNTLKQRAKVIADKQSQALNVDKKKLYNMFLGIDENAEELPDSPIDEKNKELGTIKLRSPSGQIVEVKKEAAQKYIDKGATVVKD